MRSSWQANCAANNETNGVDLKTQGLAPNIRGSKRKLARASVMDIAPSNAVGLPSQFIPTLPPANGSTGVIKSFILPSKKTGVVGSILCFSPNRSKIET